VVVGYVWERKERVSYLHERVHHQMPLVCKLVEIQELSIFDVRARVDFREFKTRE
jgi:hypothetical protein